MVTNVSHMSCTLVTLFCHLPARLRAQPADENHEALEATAHTSGSLCKRMWYTRCLFSNSCARRLSPPGYWGTSQCCREHGLPTGKLLPVQLLGIGCQEAAMIL